MRRRIGLLTLSVCALTLADLAPVSAAAGCPSGVGSISHSALTANVCVPGQDAEPPSSTGNSTAAVSTSGSKEPSPYKWHREHPTEYSAALRTGDDRSAAPGLRAQPSPLPACTGPDGQAGRPYIDTLTDTRTGEIVSSGRGCEVPGQPAGANAQPPPPPPTAAEVIRASNLPQLQFALSPKGTDCAVAGAVLASASRVPPCGAGEAPGLTGLETLLWVDPAPPAEVSVNVTIRGYSVTTRAHPVGYRWRMRQDGDTESSRNPDPVIATTTPGTSTAPAARYRWETKGDYRLSLAVVWQGSYTFSGFGVASRTESLGPVTGQPQTVPYHVIEVRSLPADPATR